jgi:uncharacterized membrane protein YccC
MDSSTTIGPTNPRDVNRGLSTQDMALAARADQRLAHAYEQIALADEQLARVNEQISKLENDGARKNRSRRSSHGKPMLRGVVALLLTAGICTAAFVWNSYGETVRPIMAQWVPQLSGASSLSPETPKQAVDPAPPAVQLAAADAANSQLPAPAETVARDAAASPTPPETTQLLQTMARDLADLRQAIEQLKTDHEALTRETAGNARQLNELKESQEQTARAIANLSEQSQRRTSVAPPLPVANPARKPTPAVAPTQARAQTARTPVQLQPQQR